MEQASAFLLTHGYLVLAAFVFVDQLGLPLPVLPVVLAAGGLAGTGSLDPFVAVGVVVLATIPADWIWYELGRVQGVRVVRALCRIALEPDTCVRTTQGTFSRHGAPSLLVAKWLPGLQTVAPPLAGASGLGRLPFLAYTIAGTTIWAATLIGIGYALRDELERVADWLVELGGAALLVLGGAVAVYLAIKVAQRQRLTIDTSTR
jgi:membrane protein DedA with SNARE-associated domain